MMIHAPLSLVVRDGETTHARTDDPLLEMVMTPTVFQAIKPHAQMAARLKQTAQRLNLDQLLATRFVSEWVEVRTRTGVLFSVYVAHVLIDVGQQAQTRFILTDAKAKGTTLVVNPLDFDNFASKFPPAKIAPKTLASLVPA